MGKKSTQKMKNFHIKIPMDLWLAIKNTSAVEEVTMTDLVLPILNKHFGKKSKKDIAG